METCPLCAQPGTIPFRTLKDDIPYHRCTSCGYISRDRSARLSLVDEMKRYRLHENSIEDDAYVAWLERFLAFALDPFPAAEDRLLDFGSGPEPVMAKLMEEKGLNVTIEDRFFSPGIPPGPFRIITAVEVFEHIPNPFSVLENLRRRIVEGGRLCISTELLPVHPEEFENWHYRSDPTHIGFFTREGLSSAARRAGFEEEKCDGTRYLSYRLLVPPVPS